MEISELNIMHTLAPLCFCFFKPVDSCHPSSWFGTYKSYSPFNYCSTLKRHAQCSIIRRQLTTQNGSPVYYLLYTNVTVHSPPTPVRGKIIFSFPSVKTKKKNCCLNKNSLLWSNVFPNGLKRPSLPYLVGNINIRE